MTTIVTAYDHLGAQVWCAAESEHLRDGLADGTLTLDPVAKPAVAPAQAPAPAVQDEADQEEADDATEDASQAEAGNTPAKRRRSSQRKPV